MLALNFAEDFCNNPNSLNEDFFVELRSEFSDAEIVDLAGYVAFCLGIGRVYKVLDIANECPVVH
ncbi:MAG: hypothetical protein Ct9H90mP30_5660 [Actinomycetota bacterium]|nr:MAG: hypothetical protein Ct9H90mP30_5660 [Actinomycetota bacterium]